MYRYARRQRDRTCRIFGTLDTIHTAGQIKKSPSFWRTPFIFILYRRRDHGYAKTDQRTIGHCPGKATRRCLLGKIKNIMKILYRDKSGFCLWIKMFEEGTFPWTRKQKGILKIGHEKFKLLLQGINIFREYKKLRGCSRLDAMLYCFYEDNSLQVK